MISTIVSRLVILVFGTLYPAYASYKAVRTKNVKEYVKWMMYWIVFALFTCAETFTDVFLSWFPFYYEIKIILVIWLLSPATKGSSILYRKFVHPMLSRREQEIDDYIAKAKEQGYHTVLNLGTKGVNYATTVIMQTAIKGGGGIVNQLRKSYSLSDLSDNPDARADVRGLPEHSDDERDVVDRHHRRRHSPRRSASGSNRVDMYFPEVDIRQAPVLPHGSHVRSTEDVSSGYSSAEPLYIGQPPKLEAREGLVRTASVGGSSTRSRTRTTRTGVSTKKITTSTVPEDSEDYESETESSEITIIRRMPKLLHVSASAKTQSQSSDESDTSDFVDTIGFPLPSLIQAKIEDTPLISSSSTTNFTQNESVTNKVEDNIIETSILQIEEANIKIEESNIKIEESNIKIEESNLTDSIEATTLSDKEPEENEIVAIPETNEITEESKNKIEIICNIQVKVEKQPSEDVFEDTITEAKPKELKSAKTEELPKEEPQNKPTTEKEEIEDTGDYETLNIASSFSSSPTRGGKYNKHTAPIPPNEPSSSKSTSDLNENEDIPSTPKENETHPIKATLVLKPGIIKSVGPPAPEDPAKTQIFVSHSPKTKRKTKNESPISRLMMLPKKIFGHKHSSNEDLKRKSWHDDSRSLTPSSIEDVKLSKSDTEGSYEQLVFKSDAASSRRHEENKMILRNLSHSPKQYRRKTKGDRCYEDSD